jgi:hypothetical protein
LRYAIVVYVLGTVIFTTWHIIAGQMGWTSPAASALLAAQPGVNSGVVTGQFTIDKDGNRATVVWSKDKPGVLPAVEVPSYKRPDAAARAARGGRKERFAPSRLGNLGADPVREQKKPVLAQGRELNKPVVEKKPVVVEEKKTEVPVKAEVPVVEKKSEKPVEQVKVEAPAEKVAIEVPAPVPETVAVAGAGAGALVAAATSVGDGGFILLLPRWIFTDANNELNPQAFSTLRPRTLCFPNCSSLR